MFFVIGIFRPTLTTPNIFVVLAFLSHLRYTLMCLFL